MTSADHVIPMKHKTILAVSFVIARWRLFETFKLVSLFCDFDSAVQYWFIDI